jgi:predicted secreted Zn-dependent protease
MKTIARLMALAALTALVFQPVRAETITTKTFAYFSVGGRTAAELDAELSKRGPVMKRSGSRHPGATRIKWGGSVTYVRRGSRCAVGEAKVTLSTQIILPRWKNRKRATPSLALIWDTLSSDIKRHEEQHVAIAQSHARELERKLMRLGRQKNCAIAAEKAKAVADKVLDKHDKAQAAFDRQESAGFEKRMLKLLRERIRMIEAGQISG